MALGDSDLASGVFFSDFGDDLRFGSQAARGLVDGPGLDAAFGGPGVSDTEYAVTVADTAFNPAPKPQDNMAIVTGRYSGKYAVRSCSPLDDGGLIRIKLRKL